MIPVDPAFMVVLALLVALGSCLNFRLYWRARRLWKTHELYDRAIRLALDEPERTRPNETPFFVRIVPGDDERDYQRRVHLTTGDGS